MGNALSAVDTGFGPQLAGHFDFTLLFEHILFTIVPAILIILATLAYLNIALRTNPKVAIGPLLWVKGAVCSSLIAVQVASALLWARSSAFGTHTALAAASLSCAEAACVAFILYAKHRYSFQNSTFLSLYLSITLLLDIAKTYSCFNRDGIVAISGLKIAIIVLKSLLIVAEEMPKHRYIKDPTMRLHLGKEAVAGFWNRSLFLWLNSTLFLGFRTALAVEDLSDLAVEFNPEKLSEAFKPH